MPHKRIQYIIIRKNIEDILPYLLPDPIDISDPTYQIFIEINDSVCESYLRPFTSLLFIFLVLHTYQA